MSAPFITSLQNSSVVSAASNQSYDAFVAAHVFANPDRLTVHDCVALGLSLFAFLIYFIFFHVRSFISPHGSLPSHFDYQRVTWTRHIWGNSTLKILTIQNIRSALMVLAALTGACVASLAAIGLHGFAPWHFGAANNNKESVDDSASTISSIESFTQIRAFLPCCVLVFALYHLSVATWAFVTILFLSNCESLDAATLSRIEVFEGVKYDARHSYATTTALSVQCSQHFRVGWRTMCAGMVGILWLRSPLLFIITTLMLVFSFYHNDFFVWSPSMKEEISSMPPINVDDATVKRLQWQQEVFGAAT